MGVLCHSPEEIERAALRLPCVPTDNRNALVTLGFERMYPQATSGYDSHLWVRAIDSEYSSGASGSRRKLVVQRAFLDRSARKSQS
jgi:hypothetical protein